MRTLSIPRDEMTRRLVIAAQLLGLDCRLSQGGIEFDPGLDAEDEEAFDLLLALFEARFTSV